MSSKSFNGKVYIGISIFSILIMILIFIATYYIYNNSLSSFSDYDPYSNPNIVKNGENGLQYVINPNLSYISVNSTSYTNKENMIDKALSSINSNGYVTGNQSSSYLNYIIIIMVVILVIASLAGYAAYYENKNLNNR